MLRNGFIEVRASCVDADRRYWNGRPLVTNDAPILLDVTRLIWRRSKGRLPTGIDRVCLAYLDHFGDRAQAVIQHDRFRGILDRKASGELFDLLETPRGGLNSPGFHIWCRQAAVKPVYLVHDLIPITHPEFCRAGEPEKHRARMRTVLTTASGVIGNSQVTIDELAEFAAAERLLMPPHIVAWLGIDEIASAAASFDPPPERPTFVTVGTIEGRKNHAMLLRIWARLVDRLAAQAPRLLIIGQRGWEADAVFNRLDRPGTLRDSVIELNTCSDAEIARHLRSSRALLFPSSVEGYGLPLLEALGTGVPVIASDLPVFREIAGDRPEYLGPADEDAWETRILDYADLASEARAAQVGRIAGFRVPTWSEHFARVEDLLRSLR